MGQGVQAQLLQVGAHLGDGARPLRSRAQEEQGQTAREVSADHPEGPRKAR